MKTLNRSVLFVLLTIFIDSIGISIIIPVIPQLLREISNTNLAGATRISGLLFVVFAAVQFLFAPVIGNLSDRFGRRPVLLISLLVFGINYGLMGVATNLTWLFVGRVLTGIAGAVHAPAGAFLADVTERSKRAHSFALLGAAYASGFVLGPVLGGLLGAAGSRVPFFVAAGLALLNFSYGFYVMPESLAEQDRRPFSFVRANPIGALFAFRGHRTVLRLMVAAFFWQMAFFVYPSTWAFFAEAKFSLSPSSVGTTLAVFGLSCALVQIFFSGPIISRMGEAHVAWAGAVVGIVCYLANAFAPYSWMLYPIQLVGGFMSLAGPTIHAVLTKQLGPAQQGELQGSMASMNGLCSMLGPFAMTQTLAYFSDPARLKLYFPGAAFLLAAAFSSICLKVLVVALRDHQFHLPSAVPAPTGPEHVRR
jgi:DHA1 family tetracycline resistance protein-like MFS transporter